MEGVLQVVVGKQRDISHGCVGGHVDSQEGCQLDSLFAVEGHGFASTLLHGYETVFPTLSLIEHPDQHHIEEHAVTFPPEVKPPGCGYIAAQGKHTLKFQDFPGNHHISLKIMGK